MDTDCLKLSGYKIKKQIYVSAGSIIYQGQRESDNLPVVLKVLKEDYPSKAELIRYRQEYEITRNLHLDGVIKAYNQDRYQNSLFIVLEDFGGESLKFLMEKYSFTLQELLKIFIEIAHSLGQIHGANVIHKDINPSNLVYNPATGQLKVIDFGIATTLPRENPTFKNPNQLEGTLFYISPEQTGRMNKSMDYLF
ncbi:MAG TPA: protein kinase [Thermodesulfovibrionia bacterium]|nr:protein kinase [Thermodesulfovibrionia bacterium]